MNKTRTMAKEENSEDKRKDPKVYMKRC